jgi:AcrR family transcriptional regulator
VADVKRRRYRSPRRQEQAEATRRAIVEAATRLLMTQGYAGTTMDAIAREADVATITVYSIFSTKPKVVEAAVQAAVTGPGAPTPILEQPGPRAVLEQRDQRRQIQGFAAGMGGVMQRVAPLFEAMRAGADGDPAIASLRRDLLLQRLNGMRAVAGAVMRNRPLRNGMSLEAAAETIWALSSPDLHQLVTVHLGWDEARYVAWLDAMLVAALLDEEGER